jgi:NTE family protein
VRVWGLIAAIGAAALGGCTSVYNLPHNQPLTGTIQARPLGSEVPLSSDDVMVSLAFSGGGTRAAAFSFGVLQELDRTRIRDRGKNVSLLDRVDFVSGVSGGSVLAAYYGLRRREALSDFRERFLLRNAEESLNTRVSIMNLGRAIGGGLNDATHLPRWLDDNLFGGATFRDFQRNQRPRIWINASDIYNRTPFIYGATTFGALCSDLASYPIAEAVAASAAVPIVFTPMVIKTYPKQCTDRPPGWQDMERAHNNPNAPPMLKAFADALYSYGDGSTKYIKLLDGGLVDNFGLSGFTISRLAARAPYDPLPPERAVQLRRAIVILVDAGRAPSGNWVQTIDGPSGMELVNAASDTALSASVRASYTAFQAILNDYQRQLVNWRCGLSPELRKRYGAGPNWNCRDIKLNLTRVAFDQLGPARAKVLNAVDTRFKLPVDQVDAVIAAGRDALAANPQYREFLKGLGAHPQPQPVPEAPPLPSEPPPTPVATAPVPSWPFPFPSLPSSFAAQ